MSDTRPVLGYGLAVVSSVVMLALTALVPVLASGARFSPLYAAVTMSSWYGGLGPGIASLILCLAGSALHILPSAGVPGGTTETLVLVAGFVSVRTVILVLNHTREGAHRARMVEREGRIASERLARERSQQYATERADRARAERGAQQLRSIRMGGTIHLTSRDAGPTVFAVSLPASGA